MGNRLKREYEAYLKRILIFSILLLEVIEYSDLSIVNKLDRTLVRLFVRRRHDDCLSV